MMNISNYTLYGIHSSTERYSWAAYHLFLLLSSLIGDPLILYASFQFRRDAFKLNEFIVSITQHIAVTDLLLSFSAVFPAAISLLTNGWVLGQAMCYASVYITYLAYPAGIMFLAVMSTSKYLLLRFPLRASRCTKRRGHQVCLFIWVLSFLTAPLPMLVLERGDVQFDYRIYDCDYLFISESWKTILPICTTTVQFLPSCIIFGTTIPTLKYLVDAGKSARRVQGSIPWQGAMTVALTASIFCISTLPIAVCFIVRENFKGSLRPR